MPARKPVTLGLATNMEPTASAALEASPPRSCSSGSGMLAPPNTEAITSLSVPALVTFRYLVGASFTSMYRSSPRRVSCMPGTVSMAELLGPKPTDSSCV